MDGVLYDSMPHHVQAWSETMASFGVHAPIEQFYLFEGRTGHSTIDILFNETFGRNATPDEKETIYRMKANRFIELEQPESRPMAGALKVLERVKALGLKRVIVTGSGQQSLFEKIDKHFPSFFDSNLMVTAYDVQYGKPHPEPYLQGLQKAAIHPEEALVVENAPLGVQSAHAAGIFTIAVNTGPLNDQVLWEAGANVLFPTMNRLAEELEGIVKEK